LVDVFEGMCQLFVLEQNKRTAVQLTNKQRKNIKGELCATEMLDES